MPRTDFYLKIAGALLLSLSAASMMTTATGYRGVVAGIAAVSALLLVKSAERSSRRHGRTDRMKVSLVTSTVLYEIVLLVGAASAASKFAGVLAIAAVSFSELLHTEAMQELKQSFSPDIGREGRIIVLALSLAVSGFNSWVLFYGLLFIAVLAVYDSLRLIHRLSREL
ncbi:MAG: hypothetical protein ABEJ64_03715 [Candidatus Nanohaloarchaea archaeon]